MLAADPAAAADAVAEPHSGGIDRPRAAVFGFGPRLGRFGAAATGVVSISNRSLGVHSSAVHNAASVASFTWAGCLVSSADTDAADSCSPGPFGEQPAQLGAGPHLALGGGHPQPPPYFIVVSSSSSLSVVGHRPPIGVLDERRRRGHVTHRRADMPVAEHLLDRDQVDAALVVVGRAGVAQRRAG